MLLRVLLVSMLSLGTLASPGHADEDPYELDLTGAIPEIQRSPAKQQALSQSSAWQDFLQTHAGWTTRWNERQATPERAQGPGLVLARSPQDPADAGQLGERFLKEHAATWLHDTDLELVRAARDRNGWWAQYMQTHRGLRVVGARAYLRMTYAGNVPLFGVMTYPGIHGDVIATLPEAAAQRIAAQGLPQEARKETPRTELVILPVERPQGTQFRLAYEVHLVTWNPEGAYLVHIDAKSGELIKRESILRSAASGTVTGGIEPLQVGDALSTRGMPHVTVSASDGEGGSLPGAIADADGNFSATTPVGIPYTLTARLSGPFGTVYNNSNGNSTPFLSANADTADTTLDFNFQNGNSRVQDRDAYYWTMRSHDYLVDTIEPGFTLLDYNMPIVTDLQNSECNAFWNGLGVTFYPASQPGSGNSCTNTARSASVVIHEYGHGITDWQYRPFAPSGAMHEGFSDYLSATMLNDPRIGHGFFGRGSSIRTIQNTRKVPDDLVGQVHTDGLIIAGALWDTRQVLGAELTDELWHFARYGFSDTFDDYMFDFLVVDDDDGNIYNGTPNFTTIVNAFRSHGIGDYSIRVSHLAEKDTENLSKTFHVNASFLSLFAIVDSTVTLHLELDGGGDVASDAIRMDPTGGIREYATVIGAQPAGTTVRYWFTATDVDGGSVTFPAGGASEPFQFVVGTDTTPPVIAHDPLPDQPQDVDAIRVRAVVTDNLDVGVGSVKMTYALNDATETSEDLPGSADHYEGLLPATALSLGDTYAYRLEAEDLAQAPNTTLDPAGDFHSFQIVRGLGRDFEANNGGLVASGDDWEWGNPEPVYSAYSESNVWATQIDGGYSDDSRSTLVLGPLDLTAFGKAALTFQHRYDIEDFWDGGHVFASTDGTTWSLLTPQGGYPVALHFLNGLPGYSGATAGWEPGEFDLSAYRGEPQVWIQFRFWSDGGLTKFGWYLDDLQLVERQILVHPVSVLARSGHDTAVPLSWPVPPGLVEGEGSPIQGYHVYRAPSGGSFSRITSTPVADRFFTDTGVVNGTAYAYAVTALYEDGESPLSPLAEAIPYLARYSVSSGEVVGKMNEGGTTTVPVTFANEGNGFLRVNHFPAFLGQTLDDVRIRYDLPAPGKGSPPRPIGPAPSGPYTLLYTDANDIPVGPLADLKTVEAQVEHGWLYVRLTAQEAWGNPAVQFNLAVGVETDFNLDTGEAGDVVAVLGAYPQQQFGFPAVLLDGDLEPFGFPGYVEVGNGVDWAAFGVDLAVLDFPESVYLIAGSVDPALENDPVDTAPNDPGIVWADTDVRTVDVAVGEPQTMNITFKAGNLGKGIYQAQLLGETNDPEAPVAPIVMRMEVGDLTPVRLLAFRAEATDLGAQLTWETTEETDHAGFHVYRRALPAGDEQRLTADLVTGVDGVYTFEDAGLAAGGYAYRIADVSRAGELEFHGPVTLHFAGASALTAPVLRHAMPNPVRSATRIRFGLPEAASVTLQVFAADGTLVRTLVPDTWFDTGYHEVTWDAGDSAGRRAASGMYYLRLVAGSTVDHRKVLVL